MVKKFIVEQKSLLSVLTWLQPICTRRTTIDATSCILFQAGFRELMLKSTDLEISLQASCPIKESDIHETESFLVPGRRIFEIVKELDGDIQFTFDETNLGIKSGSVSLTLNIKPAHEFPPFPERIENLMQLDTQGMEAMLDKVAFLIPQNNSNPALNGLLCELNDQELKMTATDGHCLAQVRSPKYKLETSRTWLLPRRAVFELKKILETTQETAMFLGVCGNQLVFSGGSFNFFSKLLADAFPNYVPILDKKGFLPAKLDRGDLIKTLRRSVCLLSGQFVATKFAFNRQAVQVSMHNKEVGKLEESLALQSFDGESLEIRFYAPYLLSGLQAFKENESTFFLKSAARPIIFESEEAEMNMTYLVMPVSPTAG
jgi:DNA polymerase-3 subunit beta